MQDPTQGSFPARLYMPLGLIHPEEGTLARNQKDLGLLQGPSWHFKSDISFFLPKYNAEISLLLEQCIEQ